MTPYPRRGWIAACLMMAAAVTAEAQDTAPDGAAHLPVIQVPSDFSIGIIDMQRILRQSTAAVQVQQEVAQREVRYREEINARDEELRDVQAEIERQRGILSPAEIAVREAEFRNRVEELQRSVNERNTELQETMASSLRLIQEQAVRIVAEIALERNYALVFDTSVVVIAAEEVNISDEVVGRLNEILPVVELPQAPGPESGAESAE